jgi:predicted ester cyclase
VAYEIFSSYLVHQPDDFALGRGTHWGEFRGIAPTGSEVEVTGIGIFSDREIVESWDSFDQLGMMLS